jgi:hypothetical protein
MRGSRSKRTKNNAPLVNGQAVEKNEGILLANLLQSSRSTFSWGSFLSFFAFQEGMLGTPISVLGGLANSIRRSSSIHTVDENS